MVDEIIADLKRINEEMLAAYHALAEEHDRRLAVIRERIKELEDRDG